MDKKRIREILVTGIAVVLVAALSLAGALAFDAGTALADGDVNEQSISSDTHDTVNILILGADRQAALCDVIMLASLDFERGSATLLQLPRDTYARYTDASYKKLNGAYNTLGGAAQTAKFLSRALAVDIDRYICLGLDTLASVVDAVGGVRIYLPHALRYSDPEQGLYINLKAGENLLDGKRAEHFVRYRSGYDNGDLGRIDAQKLFLAALFEQISESYSPALLARLLAAADNVETDLGASELAELAVKGFTLSRENIKMLTLPGEEVVATRSGASYFSLCASATARLMREHFGGRENFDSERLFLNSDYDTFRAVYEGEGEYKLLSLTEILQSQAQNSKKEDKS